MDARMTSPREVRYRAGIGAVPRQQSLPVAPAATVDRDRLRLADVALER